MVKRNLEEILSLRFDTTIKEATNEQVYVALLEMTKNCIKNKGTNKGEKKLYYISAEFLIGKLLSNNLINLGLYDEVKEVLAANGKELIEIEEIELEPSLGNGGLGRLAACFLDSIATLGLNGDGVGLNYHYGLFKQVFKNNKQTTEKNPWITPESWLNKSNIKFDVLFGGFKVTSTLYDIDVTGYNQASNKLRLFDVDTVNETIVKDGINFDKEDIKENLTLFLYPDDSDEAGHLLRIYQQYFMVSNAAQLIILEAEENGYDLHKLDEHVVVQINDTHPSMVIPELIRLLGEKGIEMQEAIGIVTKMCAYTNHTILAEALEKWPIAYLEKVVPQLIPIIRELDNLVKEKYDDERVYIIDKDDRVHMAHMDIHYGFSVNGVAALHTKILEEEELKPFYDIYPEKFNNKTNGITFRRWLIHCNNELTNYITSLIGEDFKTDATKLEELGKFVDDKEVLARLGEIKKHNKIALKKYLKEHQNIDIDENSIFDIQVKRLHEYKRQQMNVLYIIHKYLDKLTPAAELAWAVNTVINDDGVLTVHITDGVGYMRSLKDAGFDVIGKKMTIVWAGGAATAICIQAALDGVAELSIFNQDDEFFARAEETVKKINEKTNCKAKLFRLEDKEALRAEIADSVIFTNGTGMGMKPYAGQTYI